MTEKIKSPMPNLMEVDQAARLIVQALRKKKPFFAFPRSMAWRLSLLRWLPTSFSDWLIASMIKGLDK
jgi:hypothetical protein